DSYFHFVEEAHALGVRVPIVPGIMPINNFTQLARFSDACGAEIPRWIRLKLEGYGDDSASIKAFGMDVVTHLCDRLLDGGAPGLHIYTMNQAGPSSTLWQRLGLYAWDSGPRPEREGRGAPPYNSRAKTPGEKRLESHHESPHERAGRPALAPCDAAQVARG